ncbi:MAG TPA: imidazole glycerol phosphate synthase subunit HisH [Smithellaceae bacterium]|nr:imidazole glycerol phosphate synthase subunit HisH [Smithellaceae bacterium]
MIAIVHYGLGNVQAFANIYKRLNIPAGIAETPEGIRVANRLILPGVGAFDWAMKRLDASGLRPALEEAVGRGKPVLGICVGMQMMARRSDEGILPGLGWIDGEVRRFDETAFTQQTHLPHMGWNDVTPRNGNGLFRDLSQGARFYFLHSYYFVPRNPDHVLATTDYNGRYASAMRAGNVLGVQFHPEKSHAWGIQLLKNFSEF